MKFKPIQNKTMEERFFEKVKIFSNKECWDWIGGKFASGYGCMREKNGNVKSAHRISWEIHNGKIPKGSGYHGTCVLHKCDNPGCVNPRHLFLGSNLDNVNDKLQKGRHHDTCGEKNPSHKLTQKQVKEIRKIYSEAKIFQHVLGKKYGVSQTTIWSIVTKNTWGET